MEKRKRYYIIITSMIIVGIIFIEFGLNFEKNKTPIYSYTAQKSDHYEVLLKPNVFYETETLPSGGYYTSNSIKSYNINFLYDFKGDRTSDIEYHYNIVANLIGTAKEINNDEKEVWNRKFILYDGKNNKQKDITDISLNEPINIDYEYYNNLARSYEKTYSITIESILKIRFNIFYSIYDSKTHVKNEEAEDFIEVDIPINDTVSEVIENYQNITSKEIIPQEDTNVLYKVIFYVIGAIFIITSIVMLIKEIYKNKKIPEVIYNHELSHILKYYSHLIVTVIKEPDISNLKIMNVCALDDLIDVAEQTQSNIIHFEVSTNEESKFYVIVNEYVYIYTLKCSKY